MQAVTNSNGTGACDRALDGILGKRRVRCFGDRSERNITTANGPFPRFLDEDGRGDEPEWRLMAMATKIEDDEDEPAAKRARFVPSQEQVAQELKVLGSDNLTMASVIHELGSHLDGDLVSVSGESEAHIDLPAVIPASCVGDTLERSRMRITVMRVASDRRRAVFRRIGQRELRVHHHTLPVSSGRALAVQLQSAKDQRQRTLTEIFAR
jgi:hypothetical protein